MASLVVDLTTGLWIDLRNVLLDSPLLGKELLVLAVRLVGLVSLSAYTPIDAVAERLLRLRYEVENLASTACLS